MYAARTREALRGAVDARKLAQEWAGLYPLALKAVASNVAANADRPLHLAKADAGDPRVTQFLQAAYAAILAALRAVIHRMATEGWVLGQQAAQAVLGALEEQGQPRPDWRGWAPGDHEAAAKVAGAGLRELLGQAGIRIKSIADSRIEELADVLEQTLASDVTAITAEGPLPPRLSVGDLARQLEQVLDNPERAELVAWTEISRAQAEAARTVYAESGYPMVDWITAGDARVCPLCEAAQASNPHALGAAPLVPMHPRCRCAEIPVLASLAAVKAAKVTQASVRYRDAAPGAAERCGTCSMFAPPGSCTLVAGPVRPSGVCDRYDPDRAMAGAR